MTLLWIIGGLIVLAAGIEAWMKRRRHTPLSRLAQNRRRHDDPNAPKNTQGKYELDVATYDNSCQSLSGKRWKVADTPEGYAKVMMPDNAKRTDKGKLK